MPLHYCSSRTKSAAFAVVLVAAAVLTGVVAHPSFGVFRSSAKFSITVQSVPSHQLEDLPASEAIPPRGVGVNDGEVPEGVTVFDSTYPAVTKLNPALLSALRRAAADAAGDRIAFV